MQDLVGLAGIILLVSIIAAVLAGARGREEAAVLRSRESRLLYELSTLIISDLGSASTLTGICRRIRSTFGASSVAIFGADSGEESLLAADGLSGDSLRGETEFELVAAARVAATPAFGRSGGGRSEAVAIVPLRHAGHDLGVLRVERDWSRLRDDEAAMRLLNAFAQVAALAIHHSMLMQEVTATRVLQEADVLKSALLGAVSHELRTPLGSIKASVTSLLEPGQSWEPGVRAEFLAAIDEETDRLTNIVSNLLDLSRIEGGALQPARDWYDVSEFLETVVGRLRPTSARNRVSLQVAPGVGVANFDYVQMSQVVTNLVENALKFSPTEAPVEIEARADEETLELLVRDFGPGVAPNDRAKIFDRFYRGATSGQRVTGTGLGLTISKGIVEAHGGTLSLTKSEPCIGTTFRVTLPLNRAELVPRPELELVR
jgi:two-component system sensor histidine kinase KdpD